MFWVKLAASWARRPIVAASYHSAACCLRPSTRRSFCDLPNVARAASMYAVVDAALGRALARSLACARGHHAQSLVAQSIESGSRGVSAEALEGTCHARAESRHVLAGLHPACTPVRIRAEAMIPLEACLRSFDSACCLRDRREVGMFDPVQIRLTAGHTAGLQLAPKSTQASAYPGLSIKCPATCGPDIIMALASL